MKKKKKSRQSCHTHTHIRNVYILFCSQECRNNDVNCPPGVENKQWGDETNQTEDLSGVGM